MSETTLNAIYLTVAFVMSIGGLVSVKAGVRKCRHAWRLHNQPLLVDIDTARLQILKGEPWPTRGRWPGPAHHAEELKDEKRRAVYRSLALDKALSLSLSSELVLLLSAAYLGYALPQGLSRIMSGGGSSSGLTAADTSMPFEMLQECLAAFGPTIATLVLAGVAIAMRTRSKRLRRLAAMYQDPGPMEAEVALWLPPSVRPSGVSTTRSGSLEIKRR